jgi:hypothetical protein
MGDPSVASKKLLPDETHPAANAETPAPAKVFSISLLVILIGLLLFDCFVKSLLFNKIPGCRISRPRRGTARHHRDLHTREGKFIQILSVGTRQNFKRRNGPQAS